MTTLYAVLLLGGALVLALVLVSSRIRELPVTEAQVGLLAGVLAGPAVLGLVEVPDGGRDALLLESSRVLLAFSLMGVALRFPVRGLRPVLRPVLLLVLVVMPVSALVTGGLAALALGMPVTLALLTGACLCPTDPVLASDVVSGDPAERDLPDRLRAVLTVESGANDGLALPLVLLALAPVLALSRTGEALTATYQVGTAVLLGAAVGAVVALVAQVALRRDDVEELSELVLTLVLALTALGAARLLQTDEVLAVFAAGLAYNAGVGPAERERQDSLDEVANRYAVVPFFLLLGLVLPWSQWADLGWGAVVFAAGALLVRRLPVVLLLTRPLGLSWREAAFVGWFGPMGVSAVLYVALSLEEGVLDRDLFAAVTLGVAASAVVHGSTAVPLRRAFARIR